VSPRLAALREWAARLLGTLTGRRRDADLEEELLAHAELAAEDDARRGGQTAYSERARSRSIDQALELLRDQRGLPRVESLLADAVFGWRQVRAHPAVSLAAVLSLGLAMGASIGAFRIVDALLLRPLAVKEPGRLFRLEQTSLDPQGRVDVRDDFDYPTFRDYARVLAGRADAIVVGQAHPQAAVFGPDTEPVLLQYLSGNAFGVFGLQPAAGRLLAPSDDDAPGAHAVAVLSHDYWTRRFQQSPEVVGSALRLGDQVYEVIGVAPSSFIGTEPGLVPSVWVPATMHTRALDRRGWSWFQIWVRPGPDTSPQAMQQALQSASDGELRDHASQAQQVKLQPAGRGASRLQKRLGAPLWILSALVGLVLLMACATVGNLLIGLTLAREREVAVRVSLGAGRARLMQLILVEGAILALGASVLAALVAWRVPAALVGMIQPIPIPVQLVLGLDWRVAAFAAALTVAVAALVGAGPALRAASMGPQAALKRGSTPGARRMAGGLVVAQTAFCAFVVFAAVLFVATFDRLSSQPLGFSPDGVLVVSAESREGDDRTARWRRVEEVVRDLPGVESAGLAGWPLVADNGWRAEVRVDGATDGRAEYFLTVGPRFFDVLRIARFEGRDFLPGDRAPGLDADGRPVAGVGVVNEAFARRYFGGRSPVGRQIRMRQASDVDAPLQIVGLVRDTPYRRLRDPIHPIVFVPFGRVGEGVLMVRGQSGAAGLAPAITRVLQREWPGVRVRDLRPASDYVRTQMVVERLLARLCSAFALLALLLAAIGLYAVVNDAMVRRRREIGVRLALGARAADVVRAVTAGALVRVMIGLLLGLGAGVGFGRVVGAILFRVAPTDLGPLAVPFVVLVSLFALASLSPSIRAVRTDPCETLRCE
jgi:predicted permease